MPHVLLTDPSLLPAGFREQLCAWGLTCAVHRPCAGEVAPLVHECDAVVVGAGDPWLDGAERTDAAAPVLVVGGTTTNERTGVPATALEDGSLRRALEGCFARARALRATRAASPLCENYHDFVGHELRSPLTAIRTALDELAAADPGGDRQERRLLDIARRNTGRLLDTVEWSLHLLALAEDPSPGAAGVLGLLAEAGLIARESCEDESAVPAVTVP